MSELIGATGANAGRLDRSIPFRMENAKGIAGPRAWFACMALILVTMLMSACSRPPAEERLRHQVETMLEAVRTGNARGFMAGVTEDFAGNGGMDRAALHNLLRAQILANADIGISSGPWDIQVQGEHASLRMRVILAGGGRLLPDRAQTYDLTSGWREEDGEWRVYYAEWKPLL